MEREVIGRGTNISIGQGEMLRKRKMAMIGRTDASRGGGEKRTRTRTGTARLAHIGLRERSEQQHLPTLTRSAIAESVDRNTPTLTPRTTIEDEEESTIYRAETGQARRVLTAHEVENSTGNDKYEWGCVPSMCTIPVYHRRDNARIHETSALVLHQHAPFTFRPSRWRAFSRSVLPNRSTCW